MEKHSFFVSLKLIAIKQAKNTLNNYLSEIKMGNVVDWLLEQPLPILDKEELKDFVPKISKEFLEECEKEPVLKKDESQGKLPLQKTKVDMKKRIEEKEVLESPREVDKGPEYTHQVKRKSEKPSSVESGVTYINKHRKLR